MKHFLKEYIDEIYIFWVMGIITFEVVRDQMETGTQVALIGLPTAGLAFYKWVNGNGKGDAS